MSNVNRLLLMNFALVLAIVRADVAGAQTTRPVCHIVEYLKFVNKPIAVEGIPAAAEVSAPELNTVRSRLTGKMLARDDYFGTMSKLRLDQHLARVPPGGVIYVNTEGDPRVDYGIHRTADENRKALDRIRSVIHAVRDARRDVEILLDCRPLGRLSYRWYDEGAAKPTEAADYATLVREFRKVVDDDALDGLCFQAYFHKRWQDRFHNDFNGPMRNFKPAGGKEWVYPQLRDDENYMIKGELEYVPEFTDLLLTTTGWAHETRLMYVGLQQYGKPVSVLFAPGYGYLSRPAFYNTPLSEDDRMECLKKLRALGPKNLILYGSVNQGKPIYTDGPDNGASYLWDESEPWLKAWRVEAQK